jgi:hypothetical protein
MNLKDQKITELQQQHDLPAGILGQCVDETGTVDTARLGIALQTREFTKSGITAQHQLLIDALVNAYYQAQDRRDVSAMICLQSRIHKMGGRLTEREK